jgi:hypothetical protein
MAKKKFCNIDNLAFLWTMISFSPMAYFITIDSFSLLAAM